MLQCTSMTRFDATVSLLKATIIKLKTGFESLVSWSESTCETIDLAMRYALRSEHSSGISQIALIDELDQAATKIYTCDPIISKAALKAHWSAAMPSAGLPCVNSPDSFLSYAIGFGLVKYVEAKIGPDIRTLNSDRKQLLMSYAILRRLQSSPEAENYHPPMVAFLLQSGIDPNLQNTVELPNRRLAQTTIWRNFLHHLHRLTDGISSGSDVEVPVALFDIVKIMLVNGADPNVRTKKNSVLEVLENAFPRISLQSLEEIRRMLSSKGASQRKRPLSSDDSYPRKTRRIGHDGIGGNRIDSRRSYDHPPYQNPDRRYHPAYNHARPSSRQPVQALPYSPPYDQPFRTRNQPAWSEYYFSYDRSDRERFISTFNEDHRSLMSRGPPLLDVEQYAQDSYRFQEYATLHEYAWDEYMLRKYQR